MISLGLHCRLHAGSRPYTADPTPTRSPVLQTFYIRWLAAVESLTWIKVPLAVLLACASAACGQPVVDDSKVVATLRAQVKTQQAEIARLTRDLGAEKAEVAAMREVYTSPEAVRRRAPEPAASEREEAAVEPAVAMCFKDYCPCDPPQGGPDSVLCDQLEQGIEPDIQLMIAGRGMREARRQIATGDY